MYCHTTPEIIEMQTLTFQWKHLHFYKYTIFNHYGEYFPSFILSLLSLMVVKGNFTKKISINFLILWKKIALCKLSAKEITFEW